MEDLHGGACLIDEDERITVLHVPPHLVSYYAAERVKALAHVGRMRVQVETVAVTQAEHPLSGQHDESADGLHRDAPAQTHRDSIGKADLADRLLDGVTALGRMVLIHEDHLVAAIVDAHRHELAGLSGRHLLTEFSLPVIKTALRKACLLAELTYGCATIQELLVYRSEVIEGPHMLCLFCGQSYRGSVRRQRRGLPNAYDGEWEQDAIKYVLNSPFLDTEKIDKAINLAGLVKLDYDRQELESFFTLRHVIVHRNGRRRDDSDTVVTYDLLKDLMNACYNLVGAVFDSVCITLSAELKNKPQEKDINEVFPGGVVRTPFKLSDLMRLLRNGDSQKKFEPIQMPVLE